MGLPERGVRTTFRISLLILLGSLLHAFSATVPESAKMQTFAKDIAPILQNKCQDCHHHGTSAPMSLVSYEEVRPWAKAIKARVIARTMPPWFIDPSVGIHEFKDNMSLTSDQISTIVRWIDSGSPRGEMKDMPAAREFPSNDAWSLEKRFGKPDLIIESAPYTMRAKDQDQWWRPIGDLNLDEPGWVRAMELHPTTLGRTITHHAIAHVIEPGSGVRNADETGALMSYGMGKQYDIFEKDTGRLLIPGSKVSWDIHYRAGDEDITDFVQLAVWFYPKGQEPKHHAVWTGFGPGTRLDIDPNTIAESNSNTVLKSAACFSSFQPHMHRRGKAMTIEAIVPDGQKQQISSVDRYNFNWIMNYVYADDAVPCFPKGTTIHVTAWHDNTAANRDNPDPLQWVGYGDRTVDEMAIAFVNVTPISDEEYSAWAATHKR